MTVADKADWFKNRGYAHFDCPIGKADAIRLVAEPESVAIHSFHPLVMIPQKAVKRERFHDGSSRFITKVRPIGYVAHSDAAIQSYYSHLIRNRLEQHYSDSPIDECVLAYRKILGKCNVDFAAEAFQVVRSQRECDVVALDIKGFFDALSCRYLKERWKDLYEINELPVDHYAVFKSVTRDTAITRGALRDVLGPVVPRRRGKTNQRICNFREFRQRVKPRLLPRHSLVAAIKGEAIGYRKGIAQGTPISSTLANLYMLEIDSQFQALASSAGGVYRRYSDDLLFIVPGGAGREVENQAITQIQEAELEIQTAKTERLQFAWNGTRQSCQELDSAWTPVSAGKLNYLGFAFDGQDTMIRDSTVCNWDQKIQRIIRRAYYAADKRRESKLKRREIYAKYSRHGWGSVYGVWSGRDDPPDDVPRMALGNYLRLAQSLMQGDQIKRQARQLENRLHRFLQKAEAEL